MIEETGTVVAVESDGQANIKSTIQHYAWVETQVKPPVEVAKPAMLAQRVQ